MSERNNPKYCVCPDELNLRFCRTHDRVWCVLCAGECPDCETDEMDYLYRLSWLDDDAADPPITPAAEFGYPHIHDQAARIQ